MKRISKIISKMNKERVAELLRKEAKELSSQQIETTVNMLG